MRADEGQPVTRAVRGAGDVTETFVVVIRALVQAVTHVAGMKTHFVTTATVQARALVGGTPRLVLITRAVFHLVAAKVDRETVPVTCARYTDRESRL